MDGRACIIGAGSSGLAAAKTLKQNGLPFDCFELGSGLGGNWRHGNDNGRSAAYDSLHIDTSKDRMAYSDFPMPKHFPNYLHHSQVLEYFESYAEHFGLVPDISFRTRVTRVTPADEGSGEANSGAGRRPARRPAASADGETTQPGEESPRWAVTVEPAGGGEATTRTYSAVLVCNGHHWNPRLPSFPGDLDGEIVHSRDYRNPDGLEGKNVLILGVGNSGVDIACDVAPVADRTMIASRRSAHVIPRTLLGRPTDKWTTPLGSLLPLGAQRAFYSLLVRLSRGRQQSYGMPVPPTKLLTEHPTLSTELLPLVKQGLVVPKPSIERLAGAEVEFVDGSREPVDVLICATGYKITFPFLDDDLFSTEENRFPLYGKVVHPEHPGLYFIGLIQPLGAIMPLAELQAKWVAALLSGRSRLPDNEEMVETINAEQQALEERYVHSKRHTIQVDFFPYRRWLRSRLA